MFFSDTLDRCVYIKCNTVVGDNINIMKTTFELHFYFYQALNSMDTQKYGNKENGFELTASLDFYVYMYPFCLAA